MQKTFYLTEKHKKERIKYSKNIMKQKLIQAKKEYQKKQKLYKMEIKRLII